LRLNSFTGVMSYGMIPKAVRSYNIPLEHLNTESSNANVGKKLHVASLKPRLPRLNWMAAELNDVNLCANPCPL